MGGVRRLGGECILIMEDQNAICNGAHLTLNRAAASTESNCRTRTGTPWPPISQLRYAAHPMRRLLLSSTSNSHKNHSQTDERSINTGQIYPMRIDTPFLPRLSPINFTNLKTSGTTDESLPFNADGLRQPNLPSAGPEGRGSEMRYRNRPVVKNRCVTMSGYVIRLTTSTVNICLTRFLAFDTDFITPSLKLRSVSG